MRRAAGWSTRTSCPSCEGSPAHPNVLSWAEAVPPVGCCLSVVSVSEIRFGISRVADPAFRAELEAWLRDSVRIWFGDRILPVTEEVLLIWRRLAWDGQKTGYAHGQPDVQIAATALANGLGVARRNTADLERAGVTLLNPWLRDSVTSERR